MEFNREVGRAMGTAQEMVETQRASYEAVTDNVAAFQRRSVDLAQGGLKLMELQQDNLRAAQDWWTSGLRLLGRQQRTAQFYGDWLNSGYRALQDQTEQNVRTAEAVYGSVRRQQESLRELTEAWTGTYRSFFSPFVTYAEKGMETLRETTERNLKVTQEATEQGLRLAEQATERTAETARQVTEKAAETARQAELQTSVHSALGVANYDELNVDEVTKRLDGLTEKQLKDIRAYEKQNENRETLIRQLDRRIRAAS
ncbi:Hypothetical Protein RradSPS_0126 [Rubrobacter radiotolerans]|uniref:Phasin family protein n=1 Tax=Rubrobacter radiotolerans TaxID=42256 RepID=A0A023X028_RUBRA|nr:hypothetical protein [Rubrobacter radiotolerans]AHY45409.1 Hypothetical Protein RradSPS_0126 [Rubrobacter radiotolerans]MDX5892820.1 hypothetical protein [Rubrobacter radiotolerans]SMC02558.1 hypothetical protein SAMN00767673_0128 [Rubrobacter radiotolerans DSM 5868]